MKASELRIGNIIYFGVVLEPIIIKSIDPDSANILMAEPIPLTEEWLLKFGFEKANALESNNLYLETFRLKNVDIMLSGLFYLNEDCIHYDIKYVHQLQNLYFALTGEELTIKQS